MDSQWKKFLKMLAGLLIAGGILCVAELYVYPYPAEVGIGITTGLISGFLFWILQTSWSDSAKN